MIEKINAGTKTIINQHLDLLIAYEKVAFYTSQKVDAVHGYLLFDDPRYKELFLQYSEKNKEHEETILKYDQSFEIRTLIDKNNRWNDRVNELFSIYEAGNKEVAVSILDEVIEPVSTEMIASFAERAENIEKNMKETGQDSIAHGERTEFIILLILILETVLGIGIAIIAARAIAKPIIQVTKEMERLAEGDLTFGNLHIQTQDETRELARSMTRLHHYLKKLIEEIAEGSVLISTHSEGLTRSAHEVQSGSQQITKTMQELAAGAEKQADIGVALSTTMNDVAANIQEISTDSSEIKQSTDRIQILTNEGSQLMEKSAEQMERIDQIVLDVVQKVDYLNKESQKISKLIEWIETVAEQTNLLALNAAIEAARAGDRGRGFAVVAAEVRKLAGEVAQSLKDITQIVASIQKEFAVVTAALQTGYQEVVVGRKQIQQTDDTFQHIRNRIKGVAEKIDRMSERLTNIAATSQDVNNSVQEMASVAENYAAGVQETFATSEQTSQAMEKVASDAERLEKLAGQFNHLINRFKF